ncbi:MAG TPA: CPBP family intramembrane glutamic endopeptidase [Amaricoccus sp.]|nr:CPBP family intramembrane glutamic endopeptidase [Amaricoccus sp.]
MDQARKLEFALLYVGAPLTMALAMPPDWLWPAFLGVTLAALGLLALTPGFAWRELVRGGAAGGVDWGEAGLVALATAVTAGLLVWLLVPGQAFALPRQAPRLWVAILLIYPLLSALPQEIVFRVLFFRRYGGLFAGSAGLAVNALAFGLAHLMFWNWVAALLTVAGGGIFARSYQRRGFLQAVLLHAVAGGIIFTSGLGVFFYHGAVGR